MLQVYAMGSVKDLISQKYSPLVVVFFFFFNFSFILSTSVSLIFVRH